MRSKTTIQRALAMLKAEGLVTSMVGKGVYVRNKQPLVVDVAAYFAPSPGGYAYQLLDVSEIDPPVEVVQALRLDHDAKAIVRRRVLTHDGEPVELSWSYYPAAIAAGSDLAKRRKIRGGAPAALADLGYPQREFVDQVSTRQPTTEELETLDLPENVPVIRQFRVIFSDHGVPVEASVLVKGSHLYRLAYRQVIPAASANNIEAPRQPAVQD